MKKLNKYLCQLEYKSSNEFFKARGRLLHWSILLLPGAWATFGISLLFEAEFSKWIIYGLISFGISGLLCFLFWFEIRIDLDRVTIRWMFGTIPFRTIKSRTRDLIIDHRDAENLTLISQRKDYYSEDVKNNLRFEYIVPWDGDNYEFYIDYNNKEVDLTICCEDELWTRLIEGIKLLDNTANKRFHE